MFRISASMVSPTTLPLSDRTIAGRLLGIGKDALNEPSPDTDAVIVFVPN
jgi:hypothetical protein